MDDSIASKNFYDYHFDYHFEMIITSKAMGPGKIYGKILKNCALPLSKPLSYLFTKSYYGTSLPDEWESASVVPVHKKGSKSDV